MSDNDDQTLDLPLEGGDYHAGVRAGKDVADAEMDDWCTKNVARADGSFERGWNAALQQVQMVLRARKAGRAR